MKRLIGFAFSLLALLPFSSCSKKDMNFKILKDRLIELPTYTSIDYKYAEEHFKKTPVGGHGGCTAVVKDLGEGNLVVGRNMDYCFSKKSAYIVRTEVPGEYKTLGFSYGVNKVAQDFEDIKKNGLKDGWKKLIPFYCGDIINEKGLYCEIDMRNPEYDESGKSKFGCDGTNKNAPTLVNMVQLMRFLTAHCDNVLDAVEYAKKNINIYNLENDWNFAYMLADAEGNYGLLEIAHNDIYFENRKFNYQANYYLNDVVKDECKLKFGLGRTQYIDSHINDVVGSATMFNLMNALSYSNVYKIEQCPFDMRSEACTFLKIPFDQLISDDPEIKREVYRQLNEKKAELDKMSEEEKQALPWYWQSSFTVVTSPKDRSMHVRFFEKSDYIFDYTLQ